MTQKPHWVRERERLRRREQARPHLDIERPLWVLTTEEWRVLLITFAGGLGSIVVGAGMLGCALALAWHMERSRGPIWGLALATGVCAVGAAVYGWAFTQARRTPLAGLPWRRNFGGQ